MQAQNNMIEHSLNQQRIYKTNEINKSIDIQKLKQNLVIKIGKNLMVYLIHLIRLH